MKIFIIDDEKNIRLSLSNILEDEGYEVESFANIQSGLTALEDSDPDLILLDVILPDGNGIQALEEIKKSLPHIPIIMISGNSNISSAVKAIKLGAFDFLEKPLSLPKIKITVKKALDYHALTLKLMRLQADSERAWRMIGQSPVMHELNALISKVAPSNAKILIYGESGTGKELIARLIHTRSSRRDKTFVKFNSAAIPRELVESELFGFEKGAFTGALARKKGKLEEADGGTLFLDEIGDMELASQAKILRVIQEGEFERVGSNQTHRIDARIIAATNQNLPEMVQKGSFREDLYYRLNVVPIQSPPLRERTSDIPLLINHFAHDLALELGTRIKVFGPSALQKMQQQSYPGNVRELKNIMERIYLLCDKEMLEAEDIQPLLPDSALNQNEANFWDETVNYQDKKREFEIRYLSRQLERFSGNISQTATALGLQQGNLSRKISELGLK
ncbi:MAG: sigma-54 dependent transcriptional regulator [Candidatus Cloacimonetes bacterium]|nr:sigma-54 dependent transcriptional regulator [Candidatus Cloacimonadota bacterium]MDY0229000.1 sigma-54 dependent transcriptional regulator [Candidatus Cloacimonadaceae bacterium]